MTETWRSIVEFEGFYEVSDLGNVRSVVRIDCRKIPRGGHSMKTQLSNKGYPVVHLRKDGKTYLRRVHREVLLAFVGPCPTGMEGLHENDVKTNCALSNLRWGTPKENASDRAKNGRTAKGERNGGGGKLNESQVREIKSMIAASINGRIIADRFGVSIPTVQDIKHERSWAYV